MMSIELQTGKCIHDDGPRGYIAWHEWAAEKRKTHRQKRCPVCGLYKIWVPMEKRDERECEEW